MIFSFVPPYPPAAVWNQPKPTIVRIRHQTARIPAMGAQIGQSLIGRGQLGRSRRSRTKPDSANMCAST